VSTNGDAGVNSQLTVGTGPGGDVGANRLAGTGSVFGTSRQAPFDRWFRYPAGFNSGALELVLASGRNPAGGTVIDPFAGSGTVGTSAVRRGWDFCGIEAHPEIAELANLKFARLDDPAAIEAAATAMCRERSVLSVDQLTRQVDAEADLVRRCFDPSVLACLLMLRDRIQLSDDWTARYLKWALLATLRDVANVKVGWPYLRPALARKPPFSNVWDRFLTRASWIADDLAQRQGQQHGAGRVVHGDARDATSWAGISATLCATSPPYLNNFDYADATRLEMYFWGRNATWAELCADVRADMLVATTQQSSSSGAQQAIEALSASWPELGDEVAVLSRALAHAGEGRQRPKEYDRVLPQYLLGIQGVLAQLMQAMQSGAWCAWVIGDSAPYGTFVDTPALIAKCAETQGFESFQMMHLRTRGDRWRTNGTRHQVTLSEKLCWVRSP
jgi:hypothetical protein